MKRTYFYSIFLICFFSINNLYSQVVINEISNANGSILYDDNGENYDWIEIYNPGSSSVNLLNYSLTDDSTKLDKWIFPGIIIAPYSYKILLASGMDTLALNFLHTNFKLKPEGEKLILLNAYGSIIDQYSFGNLQNNHSVGRKPDGGTASCFFNEPTPNATNNNSTCYDGYEIAPFVSLNAGFYSTSRIAELYTPSSTGMVRYTLDGSIPSNSDNLYISPLAVNSTTVVSARCYSSGNLLPSKVVKRTYFINENEHDLPVFSITLDPSDLWDENTGLYVNYEEDWEKLAHVEYFDKQKVKQFDLPAGIKIQGNYSRNKPQKSFRIVCRDKYGASEVNYPLISEKSHITSFKSFNLRNGGSDYNFTRFRDAFMQRALKNSPVDKMGYEPALLFLNGEYWGQYEIREQQSTNYLLTNHGIPEDQIDLLYHKGSNVRASEGTVAEFYNMYDYITESDPQSPGFYNSANQMLDLENFTDYLIAGIYYSNRDWIDDSAPANNIRLWRQQIPEGKWRYMYWDLDMGSGLYGSSPGINNLAMVRNPDEPNVHSDIFKNLLQNTQFRHYFVNRYADLMNTVFQYDNLKAIAYDMRDSINSSIPKHKQKWGGSYSEWYNSVDDMLDFHSERIVKARNHLEAEFNLDAQVGVTLATSPPGAGRIKISTIIPDSLPWTGVYYNGVPVSMTAIPNPGFTFQNWGENAILFDPENSPVITVNINSTDTFTAYFSGSAVNPKLTFSEINYHADSLSDSGDWVELHNYDTVVDINLTGWYIKDGNNSNLFQIPFGTIIPPNGYIIFSCDTRKFVSQHPTVTNFIDQIPFNFSNSGDQIRLFKYDNTLLLSVTYSDELPWPKAPDGKGRTLELKDTEANPDSASNWFAGCPGGSPGTAYNPACITAIQEVFPANSFQLQIHPNPSSDLIMINIISNNEDNSEMTFSMYDYLGNEIKKISSLKTNQIIVSRDEFSTGLYFIKVSNKYSFITEKIIFQ